MALTMLEMTNISASILIMVLYHLICKHRAVPPGIMFTNQIQHSCIYVLQQLLLVFFPVNPELLKILEEASSDSSGSVSDFDV